MAVQHKDIPDAQLHEPKGVSSAPLNSVYVADGGGSGAWKQAVVEGENVLGTSRTYGEILTADGADGAAWGQNVWKDLVGRFIEDTSGATRPTKTAFTGTIDAFAYSVGDAVDFQFHIPHDYAVGTDIYLHVHWGHNGTAISGNLIWNMSVTVAQRNAVAPYAAFTAPVNTSINSNTISGTMNITNFPQYCHVVEEIQLSSATPSASQLNTNMILPDTIVMLHCAPSAIPVITGGTPNEPFLFTADIHYQANIEGTKNKDPDFYV